MGFVQGSLVFANYENIFFVPNRLCIDKTWKSILMKTLEAWGGSKYFEIQQLRLSKYLWRFQLKFCLSWEGFFFSLSRKTLNLKFQISVKKKLCLAFAPLRNVSLFQ